MERKARIFLVFCFFTVGVISVHAFCLEHFKWQQHLAHLKENGASSCFLQPIEFNVTTKTTADWQAMPRSEQYIVGYKARENETITIEGRNKKCLIYTDIKGNISKIRCQKYPKAVKIDGSAFFSLQAQPVGEVRFKQATNTRSAPSHQDVP